MRDNFYSIRHMERVQLMENKEHGVNGLLMAAALTLFLVVLGVVGGIDYQTSQLEAQSSQTGSYSVTEPSDIQPAYGINALQHAANAYSIQGDIK